jgi:RHS repeat-associated protein
MLVVDRHPRETELLGSARAPQVPKLMLPTGGGAVRGIGEKFQANPVTGTAALSVPIGLSPGRPDATPQLQLGYDSGHGNGPFGPGWSLGLPTIARRTDKRLPRYTDDDVYVLAGAEDLVPVGDGRYRPRIDASYFRILRPVAPDGAPYWLVTSPRNQTTVYGLNPLARIADPGDPSRIFEWLPERWYDDRGNEIFYDWVSEDLTGVDPLAPHERHRLGQAAQPARYLKRVRYAEDHLQLVLDYGDETGQPWPVRPDPYSSYRPGFEVRHWRRCQRVLMYHHFDQPELVRSLELSYEDELLVGITQVGSASSARRVVAPTLSLAYQRAVIDDEVRLLDASPHSGYTFADLDGEGMSGLLSDVDGAWYYQRNLGGGAFAAIDTVTPLPRPARLDRRQQLLDLDGDGRLSLVSFEPDLPGYADRGDDGSWQRFRAFAALPRLDWADRQQRLRFTDVDGDGHTDVMVLGDEALTWYPSAGREGFTSDWRRAALPDQTGDQEVGRLVLADMSGDGLPDLVRVGPTGVCYWPNLGHGRFAAMVTMSGALAIDHPERFDPDRIRLADIDGSGTADLVYVGPDAVRVWFNSYGNGFSDPVELPALPHLSTLDDVSVHDLLGTGTACLVWSSRLPDQADTSLRYINLMREGKPNLLAGYSNGMGASTTLHYRPSTAFYRADADAGTPWVTPLPFPVQCLARVQVDDTVSGARMVSEYSYHDGYFDRVEREFRGFARVDHTDAETFVGVAEDVVLTRQWFHTGMDPARGDLYAALSSSWYPTTRHLDPPVLPDGLAGDQLREAHRAFRGRPLRTEVYALATPAVPYLVTEIQPVVRLRHAASPHPVFDVYDGQRLEHHYEQDRSDPRITWQRTVAVDDYGNVLSTSDTAFGRSPGPADAFPEQLVDAVTTTERLVVNRDVPQAYRIGVLHQATVRDGTTGRTLDQARVHYADEIRALPEETLIASLAPGMTDVDPTLGGYVEIDGLWWMPSGRIEYDPSRFFLPVTHHDPFGNPPTRIEYDPYNLMVMAVTDPVANRVRADIDYRVLAPARLTDANGVLTAAGYDALGRLAATALLTEGDSLAGLDLDSLDHTLGAATTRTVFDLTAVPAMTCLLARERHADPQSPIRQTFVYTDGLGREAMRKVQAEGGRWSGTGRVVHNAKGLPVKQYEPFFSDNPGYEPESAMVGVTTILRYDPLGRLVRTDKPDGSFISVRFSPWHEEHFDENDNLQGNGWATSPDAGRRAAAAASLPHADTPTLRYLDPLGRVVRVVATGVDPPLVTTTVLDIEGNQLAVIDPRGITVLESRYDLAGTALATISPDAGEHVIFTDAGGAPMLERSARGFVIRHEYDAARRPVRVTVTDPSGVDSVVESTVYGDDPVAPAAGRLRGRPYQVTDELGVVTNHEYDSRGNLLRSDRNGFTLLTEYDALNRVVQWTEPDGSVVVQRWNEANLLDGITVNGAPIIANIDYNAKAQRTRVEYGNGAIATYEYEQDTFRLHHSRTVAGQAVIQDLSYQYDPLGNLLSIVDGAQPDVFFRGSVAPGSTTYRYDPLYRLVEATGREQSGQADEYDPADVSRRGLPSPSDGGAMRPYTQTYRYDGSGNLTQQRHLAGPTGTWTRASTYAGDSNQLIGSGYAYDAHGNATSLPHLSSLDWDWADRLAGVTLTTSRSARYGYDHTGQRGHKVITQDGVTVEERLYLGNYEVFRAYTATGRLTQERHTLHVMDGTRRVALIETVPGAEPVLRYQHDNHLGSSTVELDAAGALISYEEYYPFGATSYQAGRTVAEVSLKRYRYLGKERDEETGLAYHGARYYAPWLGRWISPDPSDLAGGTNRYAYGHNNPIRFVDTTGHTPYVPEIEPRTNLVTAIRDYVVGEYRRVLGHHILQSASYTPAHGARDPHHRGALSISQTEGAYTRPDHTQTTRAQALTNEAAHSSTTRTNVVATAGRGANEVRIGSYGSGRLPPTPTPFFEEVKAHYALRAGNVPRDTALALTQAAARDRELAGSAPRRVPNAPKPKVPLGLILNALSALILVHDLKYQNRAKYPEGSPREVADRRAEAAAAAYPQLIPIVEAFNSEPGGRLIELLIGRNPSKADRDRIIEEFLARQPKPTGPDAPATISADTSPRVPRVRQRPEPARRWAGFKF